jgi:hypothetical protein
MNRLFLKMIILGIFSVFLGCVNTSSHQEPFKKEGPQPAIPALADIQSDTVEPFSSKEDPSLGLQVGSGVLSILYTPFKVVYAGLGGLMGGLAYLLTAGNEHTAQSVWDASLRGTYWLTPDHLQGNEAIQFKGEPPPS